MIPTNVKSLTNLLQQTKSVYSGVQALTSLASISDLELGKWHVDPEACINITLDLASFEEVALSAYKFGLFVYGASVGVANQMNECHHQQRNGFELVKCAITQLSDTEPIMEVVWEQLYDLVDQSETCYNQIVKDIKKCIGKNQSDWD